MKYGVNLSTVWAGMPLEEQVARVVDEVPGVIPARLSGCSWGISGSTVGSCAAACQACPAGWSG